ncbi:hypothetical protein [Exiguobacterium sp. 22311]|uniref:hypothetical protein n=1 Tax=Exiguobacterium sp. 22311 TaxID=3453907 RepID=UPI003F86337B
MNNLMLNNNVHKILISSSARLTGQFRSEFICLDLCFPFEGSIGLHNLQEHPNNRTFIVVSLIREHDGDLVLPNLSEEGDSICSLLSVLYGKEFKSHGLLESNGVYRLPNIENSPNPYYAYPQYNHNQRIDLDIPLSLSQFELIAPIFHSENQNPNFLKFKQLISAALMFYSRSLNIFKTEKELAFLDLITCGEILTNLDSEQYDEETLYDQNLLDMFRQISALENGDSIVRNLKSRLYQVKRKFTYGLINLLNPIFFDNTEVGRERPPANLNLTPENIEITLKSAYDLRSKYVHTGEKFGSFITPESHCFNEKIMFYPIPTRDNRNLIRTLRSAPTFLGLERILRFALLKSIHQNGVFISSELD